MKTSTTKIKKWYTYRMCIHNIFNLDVASFIICSSYFSSIFDNSLKLFYLLVIDISFYYFVKYPGISRQKLLSEDICFSFTNQLH